MENYVRRALKVIDFLSKQKWVDSSTFVLAGHSQGAHIVPYVALKSNKVSRIGLFSPNPFGRIEENIRIARKKAECGEISPEKADSIIKNEYAFMKMLHETPSDELDPSLISWKSFSKPQIQDWLKLDIPLYLAYGTADPTSDLCDLVPLYFIRHKKNNLSIYRKLNLEHSFFEISTKGNPDYSKNHFNEIFYNFIDWSLKK